jgi:hypothetical protein
METNKSFAAKKFFNLIAISWQCNGIEILSRRIKHDVGRESSDKRLKPHILRFQKRQTRISHSGNKF